MSDGGSILQVPGAAGGGPTVSDLVRRGGRWGRNPPDRLPDPHPDPVTVAGATQPDAQLHQDRSGIADVGVDARLESHLLADARAESHDVTDAPAVPHPFSHPHAQADPDALAHARAEPHPLAHARAEPHQLFLARHH